MQHYQLSVVCENCGHVKETKQYQEAVGVAMSHVENNICYHGEVNVNATVL